MGIKPDLWRPTGFLQCFDTVGLVIWPVKIVPEMTYYVLSGTLLHYIGIGEANALSSLRTLYYIFMFSSFVAFLSLFFFFYFLSFCSFFSM